MKQEPFTDIEYSYRKKKTKREEFLEIMDEIIPWNAADVSASDLVQPVRLCDRGGHLRQLRHAKIHRH